MLQPSWEEGLVSKGNSEASVLAYNYPKSHLPLETINRSRGDISLAFLQRDYFLFTPAILYCVGYMTDMPLFELARELDYEIPIHFLLLDKPIVSGLTLPCGEESWNHAVWCVSHGYAPLLIDFLLSMIFVGGDNKAVGVGLQYIEVIDRLKQSNGVTDDRNPPKVTIAALGIDSTHNQVAFNNRIVPGVVRYGPSERMSGFFKKLLSGENPASVQ